MLIRVDKSIELLSLAISNFLVHLYLNWFYIPEYVESQNLELFEDEF